MAKSVTISVTISQANNGTDMRNVSIMKFESAFTCKYTVHLAANEITLSISAPTTTLTTARRCGNTAI
jgi:hypothetical protein